jgi:hypothetical protein
MPRFHSPNRFAKTTIGLLLQGSVLAGAVPGGSIEVAANRFCQTVVQNGFSHWEFEGQTRERMKPLLSKRLLATLDNIHDCGRDWAAHQPSNSTDKPPFVDCCVFYASNDWHPTSFVLQNSQLLSDGRHRVTVEYRFDSPYEHGLWHVAVYVAEEQGRYVVDDFEGGLDGGETEHWFELVEPPECKSGKWVAPF